MGSHEAHGRAEEVAAGAPGRSDGGDEEGRAAAVEACLMARIRSIKPDFFRHEALQDAEIANPGKYPMMVFAGLWGHCDSKGRFEWRPRQLKLDILPFLPFDMAETLEILAKSGMVNRYEVDGKSYGEIPTFEKHQRLSGKEVTEGEKHPEPNGEATGKQSGSNRDEQESQEGKGREEEGNGCLPPTEVGKTADAVPPCPIAEIINLYHETLPTLPQNRVRNEMRDGNIRARWKQFYDSGDFKDRGGGLDCFRWYFTEKVKPSEFLTGQTEGRNGRKPFIADLEWLMRPQNFAKVIEGKY
jgi:hypothetical protein